MRAKKYLWSILCVYFCYLTHGIQAIILSQNNVNFAKQWGFNMSDPQSAAYAAGIAAVTKHNGKPPFHWDHPILCHEQILVQRLIRLMPSILRREKGGKIQ